MGWQDDAVVASPKNAAWEQDAVVPAEKKPSWNPLTWDWSVDKNDAKNTGQALLGLGAGVTEGVAALPAVIPDAGYAAYNLATGKNLPTPSQELHARLSTFAPEGPIRQAGAMAGSLAFNPAAALQAKVPANFRGDLTARTGAQETAEKGAGVGLKVNPSDPNLNPSLLNRALGTVSGRATTDAAISRANMPKFSEQVAKATELPPGAPLTRDAIEAARKAIGDKTYGAVRASSPLVVDEEMKAVQANPDVARAILQKIGKTQNVGDLEVVSPDRAVTAWQKLRDESAGAYKAIETGVGNRTVLREKAKAAETAADALKEWIVRQLKRGGQTDLADEFNGAAQRIAQSHTLEGSVIPGAKAVDPAVLARAIENDVPMQGVPRTMAEFARVFPNASRSPMAAQPNLSGLSNSEGNVAAAVGSMVAGGHPAAQASLVARAGALTGIPALSRALLMRESTQRQIAGLKPLPKTADHLAELIAAYRAQTNSQEQR